MSKINQFLAFENQPSRFVKKGDLLVKTGQRSNEAFYVVKGCLRSYIIDEKGKEHIYQFAPENWIIGDLEFHKNKGNAFLNIDCIEDSEVKTIMVDKLSEFSFANDESTEVSMKKLHNRIYALQKRVIQLLSYSAEERYQEFMNTYPDLANRIPLKMIASYLGLTPEGLSRVRKDLVRNK